MGTEAMNSRLFGGIHYSFDNLTGFNMGGTIGARVVALAARDGSPQRPMRGGGPGALAAHFGGARAQRVPEGARLESSAD